VLRLDNVITWIHSCASICQLAKLLISPKYTVHNEEYTGTFDGVQTEAQFKLDPTQPGTFQKWQRKGPGAGGFISIPLAKLLNVVFPLAALTTATVTCFYVPSTNLTTPTSGVWVCIFPQQQC
jgi:hypothetical protein